MMDSPSTSFNKVLMHALLGQHECALDMLAAHQDVPFEVLIAKAQILINMGRQDLALDLLDKTPQDTPYRKWYVFMVLAKAFLQNNEPKSAYVVIAQADYLWAEVSPLMTQAEIKDCQEMKELISARVSMEKDKVTSIGDIKNYAFLKAPGQQNPPSQASSGQASTQSTAESVTQLAKEVVAAHLNPKYDWYQNASHVFITFKVVGNDSDYTKEVKIDIQETYVKLSKGETNIQIALS